MASRNSKPLSLGETFENWQELQNSIVDHGVSVERVTVTHKKDQTRLISRCRMYNVPPANCQWYLRATVLSTTEQITITKLHILHSCDSSDHYERRMHTRSTRLADKIQGIVQTNRCTRPVALRDTLKAMVHPDVQYHSARATKLKVLIRIDGKESDSFHLIPPHCEHILQRDPQAVARWRAPNGHFSNLFVCPSSSRAAYRHCRPIVAVDGAHTRSTYPCYLLLATALDANQNVLLLAYSLAPTESEEEWVLFMDWLKEAIPELDAANQVIVFDREKGLLTGVPMCFPSGHHAYCTWHMGKNIRLAFKEPMRKAFDGLVWASTPEQYHRRLARIEEVNPRAADYIRNTADPQHYSKAFMPLRRWGKETSQQVESLNRALKPQRTEVAFKASCLIWDYMMTYHYDRRKLAESTRTLFTPNIMIHLKKVEEQAVRLVGDGSSDNEVRVTDLDGHEFLVNFYPEWKCSCGDFQDMLLPCVHAWRAITITKRVHNDYVSDYYLADTYRYTYAASIPALLKEELVPNKYCGPPLVRRKRGRPTERVKMRFDPEKVERLDRRCGVCHDRGHDRRTCAEMKGPRAAIAEERAQAEAENNLEREDDDRDSYSSGESSGSDKENADPTDNVMGDSQRTEFDFTDNYFTQLLESVGSPTRLWQK